MTGQRLRLLVVFDAIALGGSLTSAARTLGLSKSVVSTHLRTLETDLGVRLVERTTRRLALTQVGEKVLEQTRAMTSASEEIGHIVDGHARAPSGVLRVASTVDLGRLLVAPVAASLSRSWPALRVELLFDDEPVDILALRLDMAVRVGVPTDSSFALRRLATDEVVIVASPQLADEWASVKRPRDLAGAPWILHASTGDNTLKFQHRTRPTEGFTVDSPRAIVNNTDALRILAADGSGFAVLPTHIAAQDLADGRLVRVLAPWIRRRISIYALAPSRKHPPRVAAFLAGLDERIRGRPMGFDPLARTSLRRKRP